MNSRTLAKQSRYFQYHWLGCLMMLMTFGVSQAFALTSTTTLPEGINSPSFRFGQISHIGEKYTSDGTLMTLGDLRSVVFDTETLKLFNSDTQKLIDALNSFGSHQMGEKFDMGVLRIRTTPEVKYFAPVYARGVTARWTLGFGLPIISYRNNISLSHENSNLAYYRDQYSGLSDELDKALNTDLAREARVTLAQKGYKTLESREESYLGDAQVVSIYKLHEDVRSALIYQGQLSLPTGPAYDTDDLMALNIFGRTNLNNTLAYSHRLGGVWMVVPFASYLLNMPDTVTTRIPQSETDTLPDPATKQDVSRRIGDTALVGANLFYEVNDSWTLGVGYDFANKAADSYTGPGTGRYDLLSANTDTQAQRAKMEVTYSSVKSYFNKTAVIPVMFSWEVSDVVAGVNIERQLVQEMNLMLFF